MPSAAAPVGDARRPSIPAILAMPWEGSDVAAAVLQQARQAYASHRWDVAHTGFATVAATSDLGIEDLAAFADAAWWLGLTDESLELSEQLYRRCLQGDRAPAAARLAVEIGFLWLLRGEQQIGSGWISRASRLLADAPECPEQGYLRYLEVLDALSTARFDDARTHAQDMQALASRFDDPTLGAIGLVFEGVATVRSGRVSRGLALCDEAMLSVHAGDVVPSWAGNLYCQVMGLCFELADVERARAWTDATERWCDQFSNAAMFTGICRVHRAQLLHLDGDWDRAEARAAQACRDLADMNVEVVAAGQYEIGELRRVRGDHAGAAQAFTRAHDLGRDPQPGWALLLLAQGDAAAARASLDAALTATGQPLARVPLLTALLDVADALGDPELAGTCAQELTGIAATFGTPGIRVRAATATGVAHLLADQPDQGLVALRDACRGWRELRCRYEIARTQVRLARALDLAGDTDGAARERERAAATFGELGAQRDLEVLGRAARSRAVPGGLTGREVEVLGLVADGATNAVIADRLTISERTVERHVSNIFLKLDVSSRTQAARLAFEHGLVGGTT
jgi:DNA-binding CsgD family transcriptional regulator